MAFGPSCEFAPPCPARITFHPRRLSRGSASPQHMRRARSPKSAQPSRRSLAAPARRRCRIELRPWGLCTPATVCSRTCLAEGGEALRSAHEILPSELVLIWIGAGFPALALLRFLGGVPFARCGSASGPSAPDEVPRGPGSTCWCSLGIALQGLLLRRPGSRFRFPGHPPPRFACCHLAACSTRRPGVLRNGDDRRTVSGRPPSWVSRPLVFRPSGHAGCSPAGSPSELGGRQRLWRGRDAARAHSSSDVGLTFRTCREEA
jgi:hypothetical protein